MALRAARAAALLLALAVPAAALGPNLVIKTPAQLVQAIKDRAEVSADTISPCVAYSIQMATPDAQGNLPSFQRTWDNNNVNDIWYSRAFTIERVLRWLKTRPSLLPDDADELLLDIISIQGFRLKPGTFPPAGTRIHFFSFDWCALEQVEGVGPAIDPTPATVLQTFFKLHTLTLPADAVRELVGDYFNIQGTAEINGCKVDCLQLSEFTGEEESPRCGCSKDYWDRRTQIFALNVSSGGVEAGQDCVDQVMTGIEPKISTATDLRLVMDRCLGFMPYNAGNGLGWASTKTLSPFAIKDLGGKAGRPFSRGVFTFPEFLSRPLPFDTMTSLEELGFAYFQSDIALSG